VEIGVAQDERAAPDGRTRPDPGAERLGEVGQAADRGALVEPAIPDGRRVRVERRAVQAFGPPVEIAGRLGPCRPEVLDPDERGERLRERDAVESGGEGAQPSPAVQPQAGPERGRPLDEVRDDRRPAVDLEPGVAGPRGQRRDDLLQPDRPEMERDEDGRRSNLTTELDEQPRPSVVVARQAQACESAPSVSIRSSSIAKP
jgi:hypothetical protein